jgi:uncharacterized membrane protein
MVITITFSIIVKGGFYYNRKLDKISGGDKIMKNKEITANQHKTIAIIYFSLASIVLIVIILFLVRGVVASVLGSILVIYLTYQGIKDWKDYKTKQSQLK